jgi:hypothetical protein
MSRELGIVKTWYEKSKLREANTRGRAPKRGCNDRILSQPSAWENGNDGVVVLLVHGLVFGELRENKKSWRVIGVRWER